MTITLYRYGGRFFKNYCEAENFALEKNPELLDDNIPEFMNTHIEECEAHICPACGHAFFKGIFYKHGDYCSKECYATTLAKPEQWDE